MHVKGFTASSECVHKITEDAGGVRKLRNFALDQKSRLIKQLYPRTNGTAFFRHPFLMVLWAMLIPKLFKNFTVRFPFHPTSDQKCGKFWLFSVQQSCLNLVIPTSPMSHGWNHDCNPYLESTYLLYASHNDKIIFSTGNTTWLRSHSCKMRTETQIEIIKT